MGDLTNYLKTQNVNPNDVLIPTNNQKFFPVYNQTGNSNLIDLDYQGDSNLRSLDNERNDIRAKTQTGLSKILNSVGQGTSTFGTALASSVASLTSGAVGLGAETADAFMDGDQYNGMDIMLNNPIMKGISDFDKYIKEEIVPTYYTKDQQDRVFSAATGTDLLNGLGFMASAVLPSQAITKLFGSMAKMVAASKLNKLEPVLENAIKFGDITSTEAGMISKTAKYLNQAGPIVGATIGRIGESSMEAYQTYESMLADGATEEEAKQGRNNVFMGNMALAASDLAQYTRWFKGASLGDDLVKQGLGTAVKDKTKGKIIGDLLKEAGQEAAEEGYQFLLSKGAEKATKGKSFIEGISEASGDLFTTTEGLKSMLLGAVLGGGVGGAIQARNSKKQKENLSAMANELTANADTTQRFITDPNTGKQIVNPELTKIATTFAFYENQKERALAAGDQKSYDIAEKMQFSELVEAKNRAGQFDEFIDQLEEMGRSNPEEIKSMFGNLPIKNGREMTPMQVATEKIQQAKQIKQLAEGLDLLPQLTKIRPDARSFIKNKLFAQEALREEILNIDSKIAEVNSRVKSPIFTGSNVLEQPELLPQDQFELDNLIEQKKDLTDNYIEISKEFKDLIAKPKKAEEEVDNIQNTNIKEAVDNEIEKNNKETVNTTEAIVNNTPLVIDGEDVVAISEKDGFVKLDYSPFFEKSSKAKQTQNQKEITDAFNNVKTLDSLKEGQKVIFKNKEYILVKDEIENVLQLHSLENGTFLDIKPDSELGYSAPIYYYGLTEINDSPVSDLIEITYSKNEEQQIIINGETYLNLYSNPLSAINYDKNGNIISVTLTTLNKKQNRTFKKYAEEIAYAILLETYNNLNNENNRKREELANKIAKSNSTVTDTNEKSIVNERDTEISNQIENEITEKENQIKQQSIELSEFNNMLQLTLEAETVEDLLVYKEDLQNSKYYNNKISELLNKKYKELKGEAPIVTKKEVSDAIEIKKQEESDEVLAHEYDENEEIITIHTGSPKKASINSTSTKGQDEEFRNKIPEVVDGVTIYKFNDDHIKTVKYLANPENTPSPENPGEYTVRLTLEDENNITDSQHEVDKYKILYHIFKNGKQVTFDSTHFHEVAYFKKTSTYEKLKAENSEDANKEIERIEAQLIKDRQEIVDTLKQGYTVELICKNKSGGIQNFNPQVDGVNQVQPIDKTFGPVDGSKYKTNGIGVITKIENDTTFIKYQYATIPYQGKVNIGVPGQVVFETVDAANQIYITNGITMNRHTPETIKSLTELIVYTLTTQNNIVKKGKEEFELINDRKSGLLDGLLYLGNRPSKKESELFIKNNTIRMGKNVITVTPETNIEELKAQINTFLTAYHAFPAFKPNVLGKKLILPDTIDEDGNVNKEAKIQSFNDFLFKGERPLIGTNVNSQIPFINSYMNYETNPDGSLMFKTNKKEKPIVKYAEELKSEPVNKTDELKDKKADIERRRQEVERISKLPFQERIQALQDAGIIDSSVSTQMGVRFPIIANINGVKVPFYRSSDGTQGKIKGNWYPFFGFGKSSSGDSWLIKGDTKNGDVNSHYDSVPLQEYAEILNSVLNWNTDIDKVRGIKKHPFMNTLQQVSPEEFNEEVYGLRNLNIINGTQGETNPLIYVDNKIKEINAKYDAELAALEGKTEEIVETDISRKQKITEQETGCATNVNTKVEGKTYQASNLGKVAITDQKTVENLFKKKAKK